MRKNFAFSVFSVIALLSVWPLPVSSQPVVFKKTTLQVLETRLRDCPEKSTQRLEKLKELFRAAGCAEESLQEQPAKGSSEPNLICTLRGEADSTILVGAHYDNEGSGHGVIDNWSGAVLLPIFYESLKAYPRKHTFIFIAFAGEEAGLLGSKTYAGQMTPEDVARARALINLDCLGLGPTAILPLSADKALTNTLIHVATATRMRFRGVNVSVGLWDQDSFSHKIPKITFHSVTQRTLKDINSFNDNFDVVRWRDYYNTYLLVAAYLAYLDVRLK
jgi:hypothetical protein